MRSRIRIGTSGDQADLESLLNKHEGNNQDWEASITHFSLGLRFFEPFDKRLGDRAVSNGISLAVHPVDINLSAELNSDELRIFKQNLGGFPFIYLEEDLGLWRYQKVFLGSHQTDPGFSESSLHQAAHNALMVQEKLDMPVVIENPPIYSGAIGMGFFEYYEKVCELSRCQMAFDVGHYLGYCTIHSLPYQMPDKHRAIWRYIKTVHFSGMKRWQWNGISVWLDQHADKYNDAMLKIGQACITNAETLQNILLEMEGAKDEIRYQNFQLIEKIL